MWTTRRVGSIAWVLSEAERKRSSAKPLNAAPLWATLTGNLRGGIFPLSQNGNETDPGEPTRPGATSAVWPWLFLRQSRPPIRKTAELPNAAPLWASVLRSVLGGVFVVQTERRPSAAQKSGDDAFSRESGPFLLRWSRPRRVGKTNIGEDAARTGHFGSSPTTFPPANLPVQEGNKRRSRTS